MNEYPLIANHGLIGDPQTAALVSTDGTLDWFCSPRFDSPSIFASLLDRSRGSHLSTRPVDEAFAAMLRCVWGQISYNVEVAPRFDYGRRSHRLNLSEDGAIFDTGETRLALSLIREAGDDRPGRYEATEDGDLHVPLGLDQGQMRGVVLETGPERNWDYRCTWIRDASFSVHTLIRRGFVDEAAAFSLWLRDRIGSGAAGQRQLDIYGEALDAVYSRDRIGDGIGHPGWLAICELLERLADNWDQPEEGIWETRGGRKDFTYGRLMCTERGAFVQQYGKTVLDASLLKMSQVGFVAPGEPMWQPTLRAMDAELVSDSLVYRYDPSASPDGLRGSEGTFSLCTFLYVDALSRAGRVDDARLTFEKMLTYANHLGLYSEEIAPTGEQIGNFQQAFTHLALIDAAITLNDRLDDTAHPPSRPRRAPRLRGHD